MKRTITLLAALCLICASALAQTRYVSTTIAIPSVITAASNTNVYLTVPALDARKSTEVALAFTYHYTGAGADVVTATLEKSVDGTYWATAAPSIASLAMAGNGTTKVTYATNIAMGGFGYLRIANIANAHATLDASNIVVKATYKMNPN
jgi:hypothetical protein